MPGTGQRSICIVWRYLAIDLPGPVLQGWGGATEPSVPPVAVSFHPPFCAGLSVWGGCLQVFSKPELELVASLCQQPDVVCIADEVYQWLVYDQYQHISIGEPGRPGGPHSPGHL